jgi:hypothetical protein
MPHIIVASSSAASVITWAASFISCMLTVGPPLY